MWERFTEPWETFEIEITEIVEEDERVLTHQVGHCRGRDGIELIARTSWVWTVRDDLIESVVTFDDPDQALEALATCG